MDVPRIFSVSRLSTTLPRSLPAETPQKSIKWEHRNGSMTLSASIASTVLHLRLLDGPATIITYHLPPLALESPPTKTSPRIVHQDSHIMFRLPSQQSGKAGLSERFQCRFASSDTVRALLDLLRPYFNFHAKSGPGPSQNGKGPSDTATSGSLPPHQSGLITPQHSGLATTSKSRTTLPSTDTPTGTILPAKQLVLPASPALVDIHTPPISTAFPPTPVSKPSRPATMSQTALNAESQLVHPESVLVPQNKDERGTGLDLESLDNDALKKQLLKGYSAPSRSTSQAKPGPEVNLLDATPESPPTGPKAIHAHTPIAVPEAIHTPHDSQSQDTQSLSRDPFAQALWNDPAVVRSFSEIPISADADTHMSAMVSHPTQIEGIKQQEPLNLVPGTPMEVELISLDTPRLADAVLPVSTPQNELEGIRFEPDPLWDEEGEAYAGWTQVDNRFPPMSKIEVDERMEDGEDLEEDYEQLQYHSQGGVQYSLGSQPIHEGGSVVLPSHGSRQGWRMYALDEVQLESLICEVILEAGFDELVERVANIVESRLASQVMQLQDRGARSSDSPLPSHPQHGWPDDRGGQYFPQEDHRPVQNFPREIDIDIDVNLDAPQAEWRGYLPPADVRPDWKDPCWSGLKDMDIDEDLDNDLELESASH